MRAQVELLLHETGHTVEAKNFQHELADPDAEIANETQVGKNCRQMIEALPGITRLSRSSGSVGTRVTITGTDFGTSQDTTVAFKGTAATPTSWSKSSIVVSVPPGAGTGNVTVTISGVPLTGPVFTVQ